MDSLLVEGVHLSINAVIRIMAAHPCVVPFLVHISNENKHRERFAVSPWPATPGLKTCCTCLAMITIIVTRCWERTCGLRA